MAQEHNRFTESVHHVLEVADDEARRFNHKHVGTEHILLGLLRERDGLASTVLTGMGMEYFTARSKAEWILGHGGTTDQGAMSLSPRARKVMDLAGERARKLGHPYIGTEHLLLGILDEGLGIPANQGKGIAAGVLESAGLRLENVRAELMREMGMR